jgi:hypothetical protein
LVLFFKKELFFYLPYRTIAAMVSHADA